MNNKLVIFLTIIAFVFGYSVYEAKKLDNKLAGVNFNQTGAIIKELPKEAIFVNYRDKEKVDLKSFTKAGKKVFVHFWATWCAPCEAEFPDLVEMMELLKSKTDLVFVLVAVNDEDKKIAKFLSKYDLSASNIVVVKDNDNVFNSFGTYKLPETFVFGTDNRLIRKYPGSQPWSQKHLVDALNSL